MSERAPASSIPADILVVEDSPVEAEVLRRILAKEGYRVMVAHDGEEGLRAARTQQPALILSDINMPLMSGYQLCSTIKYDDALWHIPVMLLTVLSEPKDIIEAINCGADAYIVKPFSEANLLGRIRSLLEAPTGRPRAEERRMEMVGYGGQRFNITGGGQQILNLLLSVYENTLNQNRELEETQAQLSLLNENLDQQVRDRTAALHRANRALTVLSAGNRAILRAHDEQFLLDDMCRMIVEQGRYAMSWVGYTADDGSKSIRPVAQFGIEASRLDPRCLSWDGAVSGDAPMGMAVRNKEPALFIFSPGITPLSCMEETGSSEAVALPLLSGNGVFGVLAVYSLEGVGFDEAEVKLLGEAAVDIAFGVGRLRDQVQRREAETANRVKSEFLANMSHELRTPLNAIIGFSEVIKDGLLGELSPEQHEYISDIYDSGRHLLSLINDILDLSKVEAGRMELALEETTVSSLLENSLLVVKEKAAAHHIALVQEVPEQLEPVCVDLRKTKQICYNLLSNALKFTPDGGRVLLRARRASREQVEHWASGRPNAMRLPLPANEYLSFLEISVEDTGIGIKAKDAPRLFQPFSQLDSSLSRHYEGTGLGLVMVMRLAQLHGGTVAVSSEPEKGSCFTVWLPWRHEAPPQAKAEAAAARNGGAEAATEARLVLVVEDDDSAAEVLRLQLATGALEVLRVASAEQALDLMTSRQPALIVLDIVLPDMDGWDLLSRIKASDSPWSNVPVIISSIAADIQKGFSLGAAHVLQKPVSREELDNILAELNLGLPGGQGRKVLIVDDDPTAINVLAAYLAESGHVVLRACDGKEGIALAQREIPDLLVLDLMMPEVSGFDVVEALKANPQTAAIPIVVVTAKELTAADHAQLNGCVTSILEKASFDYGRFAEEVRRALMQEATVS